MSAAQFCTLYFVSSIQWGSMYQTSEGGSKMPKEALRNMNQEQNVHWRKIRYLHGQRHCGMPGVRPYAQSMYEYVLPTCPRGCQTQALRQCQHSSAVFCRSALNARCEIQSAAPVCHGAVSSTWVRSCATERTPMGTVDSAMHGLATSHKGTLARCVWLCKVPLCRVSYPHGRHDFQQNEQTREFSWNHFTHVWRHEVLTFSSRC